MSNLDKSFKIFEAFHNDWALVTSGNLLHHNSMTVSWGEMGTLWNKPVVTIYIKPVRYTHNFIEDNECFVVSFYDEAYKKSLMIMGSKTGRDSNKDELSNLTPYEYQGVTLYKEAKLSLICKKIYQNDLDLSRIPNKEIETYYIEEAPHTMYIGEVIEIIEKSNF